MKILILCHRHFPSIGGIEVYAKGISERLARYGEKVAVFTSNALTNEDFLRPSHKGTHLPSEETINGVNIKRFPVNYKLNKLLFNIMPNTRVGNKLRKVVFKDAIKMLELGPCTPKMIWDIIRFKPDVVCALTIYKATTYFCYLAKKIFNFQLVIMPSLLMTTIYEASKWLDNPTVRKVLKSSNSIVALTTYERDFLISKGIDEKKISLIGCAIEPSKSSEGNNANFRNKYRIGDELLVTFLGRRSKGKGTDVLIDAMRIVWRNIPNVKLVLAGTKNPDFVSIEKSKIETFDAEERKKVVLIDDFTEREMQDIFAACDVFAMPSNVDSFGTVYLQAWICGKPVIACKNSPPSTVISDGEDGLLVEYGNRDELASAILELLNKPKIRTKLGERGKAKVLKNYTWDIVAERTREELYKLVSRSKG